MWTAISASVAALLLAIVGWLVRDKMKNKADFESFKNQAAATLHATEVERTEYAVAAATARKATAEAQDDAAALADHAHVKEMTSEEIAAGYHDAAVAFRATLPSAGTDADVDETH